MTDKLLLPKASSLGEECYLLQKDPDRNNPWPNTGEYQIYYEKFIESYNKAKKIFENEHFI